MQKWHVMFVRWASLGGSAIRSRMFVHMVGSSKDVGLAAVKQAVDADGGHRVSLGVVAELDPREVLGGLPTHHLAAVLGIEDGVVATALESPRAAVVGDGAAHVGAHRAVGHDVLVRPHAA